MSSQAQIVHSLADVYHILSLDGGGIRGLLTATLLERLETARPGTLAQVDLFAGTSTGGILALGLAASLAPRAARDVYEKQGHVVFADTPLDNLANLGHAIGAQYSAGPLRRLLTEQFGNMRLSDLPRKVLIAAFDLDNGPDLPLPVRTWKPKFFHNFPGPDSDGDELVVDVALRTSAAPSYFPIHQGYVDGGVVAGNPSMAALAQALEPTTGQQSLAAVSLLSIGTGRNARYLTAQANDWGWVQWAPHIIEIVLDGTSGVADYECRQLLSERYHRLNPLLPERINLDDVDKIPRLAEIASRVSLEATLDWLQPAADPHGPPRFPGWREAVSPH
jgi:patatin-like phospholipase/acyl hydrolase